MPVETIFAGEEIPFELDTSIYLCGPTTADRENDWRIAAVENLTGLWDATGSGARRLVILYPEPRTGELPFDAHVAWEERALGLADVVLFFVPRSLPELPGLISNVKWGRWYDSGRVVLGSPAAAERNEYLERLADFAGVETTRSLPETVRAAVRLAGGGLRRNGALTRLPAAVVADPLFDRLLRDHGRAGRAPDSCRCRYTRVPPNQRAPKRRGLDWAVELGWHDRHGAVTVVRAASVLGRLVVAD